MYRIVIIILLIIFSSDAYSQIGLIPYIRSQSQHHEEKCDTINIDKCYLTYDGTKIVIDTNVQEETAGWFTIVRVLPLSSPDYCMLSVCRTDTIYTMYDSTMVNDVMLYMTDTSFTEKLYEVLVRKDEITNWNKLKKDDRIHLRLRRYYNEVELVKGHKNVEESDNLSITVSCDNCYIIILLGKEVRYYHCPLFFNNFYRLLL